MRLNVQHWSIRSTAMLDNWVERQIFSLQRHLLIEEANVRLCRQTNASPAFHVKVHLVTPGPDVVAESRDHTLRAAFEKVMRQLRDKISARAAKRLQRIKSKLHPRRAG